MKTIYQKTDFTTAPGGNIYEWKEAQTDFKIIESGIYIIAITASARNKKQNGSEDDDDLRVTLDGYKFGKKEVHHAKTSWKGFGTAAAWDGASLKGGVKTVYFFVKLEKGTHTLLFTADEKPELKKIEVLYPRQEDNQIDDVLFDFNEIPEGIKTDTGGIPWKSFVFQSPFNTKDFRVELVDIMAHCKSGKQKDSTDGDNIKIYANGEIVLNPKAPTSDKYKNFFFSGDQMQGNSESLMIGGDQFLFESGDFSLEIWYDEKPILERVKIELAPKATYNQDDTFERRFSRFLEWLELPANLMIKGNFILESVSKARDYCYQYADEHGFFVFDQEAGRKIRLIQHNEVDACRHFTWNVLLTRELGAKNAEIITTNHEIFWRRSTHKSEFARESIMDLWNNAQGRKYAVDYPQKEPIDLFHLALSEGNIIRSLEEVTLEKKEIVLETFHKILAKWEE